MISNQNLTLSPNGATLTSVDTSAGELFYLSSAAKTGAGDAIRGGVPIIAPWFATFLGHPQHGWARISRWDVARTDAGFRAELVDDSLSLALDVLGREDGVDLRLIVKNLADLSRSVQFGFHPYFAVSDVEQIYLTGLEGIPLQDRIDDTITPGPEQFRFEGEVDKIGLGDPTVVIHDAGRTIAVESRGADSTVVWNPGLKKADTMADIGPREWNRFVCVEPMMLGGRQQGTQLSPGEINTIEMSVTVTAD